MFLTAKAVQNYQKITKFNIFVNLILEYMPSELNILVTNDDGYTAKGLETLAEIMRHFGRVTVIAPKFHQSGMSTAVTIGFKPIAFKKLGNEYVGNWSYLDSTPASCVKFGMDMVFTQRKPDVVVCGINHGSNAATAVNYSGTLGAAEEAAINGVPGIGVSLDSVDPDADFSSVKKFFPSIFKKLMKNPSKRKGVFYNINFPSLQPSHIKGIKVGRQGSGHWVKEFEPWNESVPGEGSFSLSAKGYQYFPARDDGESRYMMKGEFVDDTPVEDRLADHHIIEDGFIAVVPHNIDLTDYSEIDRLESLDFNQDF